MSSNASRWRRGRTDQGHPWLAPRCVCQWPDTEHCRAGNHDRCYVRTPWSYAESTLRWANGSPVIDRSVPRAERKPVEVWHARWTCKWRCRCDCHTTTVEPAREAPPIQAALF